MTDFDPSQVLECERERLANSGLVQPHGALLFIDKASGAFRHVSANAELLLGEPPESLLGQDGRGWLEQHLPDLPSLPTNAGKRLHLPGALDLGRGELDVLLSPNGAGWILEVEPMVPDEDDPGAYRLVSAPPPIDAARLGPLRQSLVETVADMTGYARTMLYRFHPDWSGEVLAEAVRGSDVAYLGLRFPASDIPAIARGLYAQTPYRHIPDAAAAPVALLSAGADGTALDLTWSDLRSVSPVHAQYLHNMGVRSSFSVSVVVEGKLWGLVACHHPDPKAISLRVRQRCKELVGDFAAVLQVFRKGAQRVVYESLTDCLAPVEAGVAQGKPLPEAVADGFSGLAGLFGASGGALFVDGDPTPLGEPRASGSLTALHQWCLSHQEDAVLAVDRLPASLRETLGDGFDGFHGFLSVDLRAKRLGGVLVRLYLLRPEEATEIAWAGNPEKPLESTADGLTLSPRHSFERWVEVRHGCSRPWEEDHLFAAQQLRERLMAAL